MNYLDCKKVWIHTIKKIGSRYEECDVADFTPCETCTNHACETYKELQRIRRDKTIKKKGML